MDILPTSSIDLAQAEVAEQYERIEKSENISDEVKLALLEFLQVGMASSDEPVSIRERLILAHASMDELDISALAMRRVRSFGSEVLTKAVRL